MAQSATIYVDPDTAEMVETLANSTRLKKAEILRQAVALYRDAIINGEAKVIFVPAPTPTEVK